MVPATAYQHFRANTIQASPERVYTSPAFEVRSEPSAEDKYEIPQQGPFVSRFGSFRGGSKVTGTTAMSGFTSNSY